MGLLTSSIFITASFVLAVPFCMVIGVHGGGDELKGQGNGQAGNDQLAYDFIKISLTAHSLTAILGGILIHFLDSLSGLLPVPIRAFRPVMHIYALMFVAESGTSAILPFVWDKR